MKTFVIGDIHGAYQALVQCLERSGFDRRKDRLIVLGDVCDGYPQVRECFDELLKIKHLDYVIGNHDLWALDWAKNGKKEYLWLEQGGYHTLASYGQQAMPDEHIQLLEKAHPWMEEQGRLFVHGGFNPWENIAEQELQVLVWDRDLFYDAARKHAVNPDFQYGDYQDIFIGHTTTETFDSLEPLHFCNVWNLDTGAGWSGRLTMMDVKTKEYWQADLTSSLYGPNFGKRS